MKSITVLIFTLLASIFFSASTVSAQSASTNQIGLRLGGFSGFTFRHVNATDVALQIDLLANYWSDWGLLQVMAQKHIPLDKGFVIYLGGGGFIGGDHDPHFDDDPYWNTTVGILGVVGIDYYFPDVPLTVGLDLTPRFAFYHHHLPWDGGLSVRYIF